MNLKIIKYMRVKVKRRRNMKVNVMNRGKIFISYKIYRGPISTGIRVIKLNFCCLFSLDFTNLPYNFICLKFKPLHQKCKFSDWQVSVWNDKFAPSSNDWYPKKDFEKQVQICNTVVKAAGVVGIILFVWSINNFAIKALVAMVNVYIGNV